MDKKLNILAEEIDNALCKALHSEKIDSKEKQASIFLQLLKELKSRKNYIVSTPLEAECRACGKAIFGKPYYSGGNTSRLVPLTWDEPKANYYGGYVCSKKCDYDATLSLEQSMPGHGCSQSELDTQMTKFISSRWQKNDNR